MNNNATYLSYRETGAFSRLVSDYIDNAAGLQPFFAYTPDIEGIKKAIANREANETVNRAVLVQQLTNQYKGVETSDKVKNNINSLSNGNAYTICTAHQPNLFTGHLYFIYKILHAVKLADTLNSEITGKSFIPVFYMGSEDADLEELGQVSIHGKKIAWDTEQQGAVGRMKVDDKLIRLIDEVSGQLSVEPHGDELMLILKECYAKGLDIQSATFLFINKLFAEFGLIVLLPDNPTLKALFTDTLKKELTEQFSSSEVGDTIDIFPKEYKVQAGGRDINLFYLKDDVRARIEKAGDKFNVAGTSITFSEAEMLIELENFPERFSPNVITRPLYQEKILPNVAFIGGGAELAYWLELKSVFERAHIPYPVLVLRNSFMVLDKKSIAKFDSLGLSLIDLFKHHTEILSNLVMNRTTSALSLDTEKHQIDSVYAQISRSSKKVDPTLERHVQALATQALKKLDVLEKKLLKAEKRKFAAEERHINKIKEILFPGNSLQERVDNLLPYYAKYGKVFLHAVYKNSHALEMKFCVLEMP